MRTTTALMAITWLVAADMRAQDDAAKERQLFQGTWTFVSVEIDGKDLNNLFKDAKAVVKGDRVSVMFPNGGALVRTFKVFTDTKPPCVDFLGADGKGDAAEGIYELKDKRLKVLVNIRDGTKERPTDFAARGKSGHIFYVLKRQE